MKLPDNGPYSALKRTLAQISLNGRIELAKDNIIVSVVCHYIMLTNSKKTQSKQL